MDEDDSSLTMLPQGDTSSTDIVMKPLSIPIPKNTDELQELLKEYKIRRTRFSPQRLSTAYTLKIPEVSKITISRNLGQWRRPNIPERILLQHIKPAQRDMVIDQKSKFLAAIWFNGGHMLSMAYPVEKAAEELEAKLLAIVGSKTDLQVLIPEPAANAFNVPAYRLKYAGPYILLVQVEDPEARIALLGQQTFDFSPLMTFHIVEFSSEEPWTVGIFEAQNIPKDIEKAKEAVHWTFLSQIWEDSLFRRRVKQQNVNNPDPTTIQVIRATRTLTVESLVMKNKTRWILYMSPLSDDLEETEELKAHLRSRDYTDGLFLTLKPVKGQSYEEPIICTICKADDHSAAICTFAQADPPLEDWNGPTCQVEEALGKPKRGASSRGGTRGGQHSGNPYNGHSNNFTMTRGQGRGRGRFAGGSGSSRDIRK